MNLLTIFTDSESLMWNSEHVSVFDMFVSYWGRTCPVMVMVIP